MLHQAPDSFLPRFGRSARHRDPRSGFSLADPSRSTMVAQRSLLDRK